MLQNDPVVAKIGVDTAENRPRKGLENCTIERTPMVIGGDCDVCLLGSGEVALQSISLGGT